MQKGIILLAVVPLREEALHRAQMVSQLLFGEVFTILEDVGDWLKIQTELDDYEGYLQKTQATILADDFDVNSTIKEARLTAAPVTAITKLANNSTLFLPAGSKIPMLSDLFFDLAGIKFKLDQPLATSSCSLIDFAKTYLNTPYLWAGRTHFGIDCSGFAQAVFANNNVQLKRDAWQQASQGSVVDFLQAAQTGDLAFFDNPEGRIVHVGIMLDNQQIIHASGRVKIDRIDDQGIYSAEQKKYTHKLRIIKRILTA